MSHRRIASSQTIGVQLLALLGIHEKRVRKAVITLQTNEAVIVDLEVYGAEIVEGELEVFKRRFEVQAIERIDQIDATVLGSEVKEFAFSEANGA